MQTIYYAFFLQGYVTKVTSMETLICLHKSSFQQHQLEKFPEHIKPPSTAAVSGDTARSVEESSSEPAGKASIDQHTSETTKVTESINNSSTSGESATASTGIVHSSNAVKPKQRSKVSADINSSSSEAPASRSNTSVSKSKTKKGGKSDNPTKVDS